MADRVMVWLYLQHETVPEEYRHLTKWSHDEFQKLVLHMFDQKMEDPEYLKFILAHQSSFCPKYEDFIRSNFLYYSLPVSKSEYEYKAESCTEFDKDKLDKVVLGPLGLMKRYYCADSDLVDLSMAFKDKLFIEKMENEDEDKMWFRYYLNGKCQTERYDFTSDFGCKPTKDMALEPFNPKRLTKPYY